MHAGLRAAVLRCGARGRRRVGRKLRTAKAGVHKRASSIEADSVERTPVIEAPLMVHIAFVE